MTIKIATDIEIAQQAKLTNIDDLATQKLDIDRAALALYGRYKAKLSLNYINSLQDREDGKLVLVTARDQPGASWRR